MKRILQREINCGETTCASAPGAFCHKITTSNFGTRWYCGEFGGAELQENASGWLQRLPECLAAEVKP